MQVLNTVRSSASSFNVQYPFASLRSSSSCLRLLLCLNVIYVFNSIFPSIMCFRRQFLRRLWLIKLAFLLFILRRIFRSLTLCNTSSFLTRSVRADLLHPSAAPRFKTFQSISDLLSEMSKFQHHKMLCSKCSISLVSSWNLSPVCYWKESFFWWMLFLPRQSCI